MDQRGIEHSREPESLIPENYFCPFGELNNAEIPPEFEKSVKIKVGTVVFHFSSSYPGARKQINNPTRKFVWAVVFLNPRLKPPELERLREDLQLKIVLASDDTESFGIPETQSPTTIIRVQNFIKPEDLLTQDRMSLGRPLHLPDKEIPTMGAILIDKGEVKQMNQVQPAQNPINTEPK